MDSRGVARPMAQGTHGGAEAEHPGGHGGHGTPYSAQRDEMLASHHRQTLWVYWTIILLGVWTMFAPLTFGYGTGLVAPKPGGEPTGPTEM